MRSDARAGAKDTIGFTAWQLPDVINGGDIVGGKLSVSYDGGKTWTPLHLTGSVGDWQATLTYPDDASRWVVIDEFVVEMAVGLAVGVLGGFALIALIRRAPLPDSSLYPIAVLLAVGVIYGTASVAHGSGFLAVFVAGILAGDVQFPARSAVRSFHSALSDLGELAAFVALGLTVDLTLIGDAGLWWQGLVLAALLGFVIRPVVVGPLLATVDLTWGERGFVVWSGLKGAVPILLASLAVVSGADRATEIYGIVFVVVLFSVVVQGSLVPTVATRVGVEMAAPLPTRQAQP